MLVFSAGLAAAAGGTGAGFISAAIAVGVAAMALPLTPDRLPELATLAVASSAVAAITGRLQRATTDADVARTSRQVTAARLSAALDRIDIGVILLDPDTRAEFINRAYRDTFDLPDDKAETRPPFIALMYHGRDTGAFAMADDDMAQYIAERTERIRSGDPAPRNMTLSDGRLLRISCAALPDGSRMVSYAPVDGVLRRGDDPAERNRYLAMRGARRAATTDPLP